MLSLGAAQFRLLERLCNAAAVSGDEGEVRKIVMEALEPVADDLRVDALGSVLATRRGQGRDRPRVLLDAHMDEVGFMIVSEGEDGVYEFESVGVDKYNLAGKQLIVGRERAAAVIGVTPIHLLSGDERTRVPAAESLRIDMGPGGKANLGDRAAFATKFRRVGPSIFAKAIDDRIGVAILIELLRNAPPNIDLCAAFSVQDEVGLRGAGAAAHHFDPHLAVAIDSTPAYDLPAHDGGENQSYNTRLGFGPAIYVKDGSTLHDPRLVRFLQETAERAHIPYQLRQPGGGSTDAGRIQLARAGIPTVSVSVPHRYPHSPISVARIDDWRNTLNLVHTALARVTRALVTGAR